ncbi:MAG: DUF1616 domain-containing protein [Dehalococcoidales bacterium]|nr:DUF1616 domain-containing protein [Dehalococcoidales bacterium]
MKIKILNLPIMINIVSVLLILAIFLIPSYAARIILGLPFLLFLPGYALLSLLFVNRKGRSVIELIALSIAMSIAICGLIGLGLNYTSWGIKLEPVLYSVAAFTLVTSAAASIRGALSSKPEKLILEYNIKFSAWQISGAGKSVFIILIVSILGALGVLGYIVSTPRTGEAFTEFYVLGLNGQARNYPSEFIIENSRVTGVRYSQEPSETAGEWGRVTLGIVNHEQQTETYFVRIMIDQVPVSINYAGSVVDRLGPIELQQGERWEQETGFAPLRPGDRQNVEFVLQKGDADAVDKLNLWCNVRER